MIIGKRAYFVECCNWIINRLKEKRMKKILGIFLSLVLLISLSINVTSANSELAPIAKYNFDNDSGTSVIDSVGSNDGTNKGATYVEGWNGEGKALSFNGKSSYVQFNERVVPIGKKSIKFKIRTNVKPASGVYPAVFDTRGGAVSGAGGLISFTSADGSFSVQFWHNGVNALNANSKVSIADNNWHDVLITFDGSELKLYVDDMMTPKDVKIYDKSSEYHSQNLILGKQVNYFNGQIDEFEIYNDVIEPIKQPETVQSKLFVGNKSVYKLTIDGDVYAWGENSYGQLGLGDTIKRSISQKEKVNLPEKITNLVMGQNFVMALGESGTVYGWGDNASGVLADGEVIIKSPIVVDSEITDIIDIN